MQPKSLNRQAVAEESVLDISSLNVTVRGLPLNRISQGLWNLSEPCFTAPSPMSLRRLGRSLQTQINRAAAARPTVETQALLDLPSALRAVANEAGGYTLVLQSGYTPARGKCPFEL